MAKTDEEIQKEQEEKLKAVKMAYSRLFSTDDGKMVLKDMMEVCFMLSTPFVSGDSHATSFNVGGQAFVQRIFSMMNLDFEKIKELIDASSQEG